MKDQIPRRQLTRIAPTVGLLHLLIGIGFAAGRVEASQTPAPALATAEAKTIAMDAYSYGYWLITTEVTRVQATNVPAPADELQAPMRMFSNVPRYSPGVMLAIWG